MRQFALLKAESSQHVPLTHLVLTCHSLEHGSTRGCCDLKDQISGNRLEEGALSAQYRPCSICTGGADVRWVWLLTPSLVFMEGFGSSWLFLAVGLFPQPFPPPLFSHLRLNAQVLISCLHSVADLPELSSDLADPSHCVRELLELILH